MNNELLTKLECALTHGVDVCDRCKMCEGENGADIRLTLIDELKRLVKEK